MIFVYKKSPAPFSPWAALRHGGSNNLAGGIRDKYLLLTNVDIIHREGAWHYVFEFDGRDTLEVSDLGRLAGQPKQYPNDIDWKQWLGSDWQVINGRVREEILSLPPDNPLIDVSITDMRPVAKSSNMNPVRRPLIAQEHAQEKPNFMLAISDA
jgi:hypothetical protein